jgi:hypothetical protein
VIFPGGDRLFLAGGISAENVWRIRGVSPPAIDLSSILEESRGRKDKRRLMLFRVCGIPESLRKKYNLIALKEGSLNRHRLMRTWFRGS